MKKNKKKSKRKYSKKKSRKSPVKKKNSKISKKRKKIKSRKFKKKNKLIRRKKVRKNKDAIKKVKRSIKFDKNARTIVQNFLKKPETDSTAINTILEIEAEKQKRAQKSNAKYWVIGGAIVGLLVLTTVVIIKKSK